MATPARFENDEEREISRGGKATAIWTMSIALVVIVGGILLATELRHVVSPPARPGTTEGKTPAGEVKPASPGANSKPAP